MESVLILPIVLFLLSGPIFVKGQGPVYLFGKNITLSCVAAMQNAGSFTWTDTTENIAIYTVLGPDVNQQDFGARNNDKYKNFNIDNNHPNDANLLIKSVEVNDAGMYTCMINNQASPAPYTVSVEALPLSVSISCTRNPSTDCISPSSPTSDSFSCNCTAISAYPSNLQFGWSGGDATDVQQSQMNNTERNGTVDFYTDAEITPTLNSGSVTCTLNGYAGTWRDEDRNAVYNINPPTCELKSVCNETNTGVSLTCTCTDASPAEGLVYSFFNDGKLLSSEVTNFFETAIEMGQEYTFGCRGCNGVNYGSASYVTQTVTCKESTTALPTTTITTVPLSTKEPTSTKATDASTSTMHTEDSTTESTTEKSGSTTTEKSVPPPSPWVIILSSAAALVVCGCGVLIIICLYKKGKCGSNSSSDKLDDNGAGPRGDPEIPAYGVVDKNRTKDPTPAPRSSMRDSKNPSNPKQDGPLELQYAALDHGNKPPSDEVRKPKEEPTEYATVQSVIV